MITGLDVSGKPPEKAGRSPFPPSLAALLYHFLLAEPHLAPAGKAERGFVAPARQSSKEKDGFETKRQSLNNWHRRDPWLLIDHAPHPRCLQQGQLESSIGKTLDLESVDPELLVNFSVIYWSRQISLSLYFLICKMGKEPLTSLPLMGGRKSV